MSTLPTRTVGRRFFRLANTSNQTSLACLLRAVLTSTTLTPTDGLRIHNAIDVAVDGAIQSRSPEIDWRCVSILLNLGADPSIECNRGKTPLDIIDDYGVNARSSFDEFTRRRSAK